VTLSAIGVMVQFYKIRYFKNREPEYWKRVDEAHFLTKTSFHSKILDSVGCGEEFL
jgi:hypothetical protein